MLRLFVFLSVAGGLCAQSLAFDAASVKPNHSGSGSSQYNTHSASLEMTNVPLATCIQAAFNLKPNQVSGPSWLESERFDIMAKAGREVKERELMEMLQTLLADRFKLAFHRDTKQMPAYSLVVDKGGLKIQPVVGDANNTSTGYDSYSVIQSPMSQVVKNLSRILHAPVIDDTKVSGNFTFTLKWTPEDTSASAAAAPKPTANGPSGPSIFEALREQLGLKLEEHKIPLEVLVVDHVERIPTEN